MDTAPSLRDAAPLFDPDAPDLTHLAARRTDPETSHDAAVSVDGPNDRRRVFEALAEHGPLTDFELAEKVDRQQTSAGKRRLELREAGLVEYAGFKRDSPSGTPARVWMLTHAGMELAESGASFHVVRDGKSWRVEQ